MRRVGLIVAFFWCSLAVGCSYQMDSGNHPDSNPRVSSPAADIVNTLTGAKIITKEGLSISQEHMRGTKQYEDAFGGIKDVYVDDDPTDIFYFKSVLASYYTEYTKHAIRYRNNLFCATINPDGHGIDGLKQAIDLWRFSRVYRGVRIESQPIAFETQKLPDYCWVGALQFIRKYQHGIYVGQDELFEMGKGGRKDIQAGNFMDIIRAYGEKDSVWVVANHGETMLVKSVQHDLVPLLAMSGVGDDPGHTLLVLGVTFSFVTSGNGYTAANAAIMIPLSSTLIRPSHFVFHELLIYDPRNAMVSEVLADDILPHVDFMAVNVVRSLGKPFSGEDVVKR